MGRPRLLRKSVSGVLRITPVAKTRRVRETRRRHQPLAFARVRRVGSTANASAQTVATQPSEPIPRPTLVSFRLSSTPHQASATVSNACSSHALPLSHHTPPVPFEFLRSRGVSKSRVRAHRCRGRAVPISRSPRQMRRGETRQVRPYALVRQWGIGDHSNAKMEDGAQGPEDVSGPGARPYTRRMRSVPVDSAANALGLERLHRDRPSRSHAKLLAQLRPPTLVVRRVTRSTCSSVQSQRTNGRKYGTSLASY